MTIEIRKADLSDYDSLLPLFSQVHDLHVKARPDLYKENKVPVSLDYFKEQLDDGSQYIFVAEAKEKIVGVAVLKYEEIGGNNFINQRKVLSVNNLCVDEACRGQGIGKLLIEYIINLGKQLEVDSIDLGVSESNQSAIKFYESLGLTTKHRRMEYRLSGESSNFQ